MRKSDRRKLSIETVKAALHLLFLIEEITLADCSKVKDLSGAAAILIDKACQLSDDAEPQQSLEQPEIPIGHLKEILHEATKRLAD